jgi:hypothetical protein
MNCSTNLVQKIEEVQQLFKATTLFLEKPYRMSELYDFLEVSPKEFRAVGYECASMQIGLNDLSKGIALDNWIDFYEGFQEKYPAHQFCLIMGSDNLMGFHKWKNHERILELCDLYIYPRPNTKASQFDAHKKVHHIDAPVMELSSTRIREAVKNKKDVSFMLPPNVWEYIEQCGFYTK